MTREEFIQAVAAANPEPLKSNLMQARIATLRKSEIDKLKADYLENLGYSDPELIGKQFEWETTATTDVPSETWAERFCDAISDNAQKTLFDEHDVTKAINFHHRLEVFLNYPEDVTLSVRPNTQSRMPTARQQAQAIQVLMTKRVAGNMDTTALTNGLIESGEQFVDQKKQYLSENGMPLTVDIRQLKWSIKVTPLIPASALSEYFYAKFVKPLVSKRLFDDSFIESTLSNITNTTVMEVEIQLFKKNPQSFKVEVESEENPEDLNSPEVQDEL